MNKIEKLIIGRIGYYQRLQRRQGLPILADPKLLDSAIRTLKLGIDPKFTGKLLGETKSL